MGKSSRGSSICGSVPSVAMRGDLQAGCAKMATWTRGPNADACAVSTAPGAGFQTR